MVIVGGGRDKEKRKASIEMMRDLNMVLSELEFNLINLWWDEHGILWWMKGENNYQACTIIGGKIVNILNDELWINSQDIRGTKINLFWPVVGGEEYGYCGISGWAKMNGVERIIGVNGLMLSVSADLDLLRTMIEVPTMEKIEIGRKDWLLKEGWWLEKIVEKLKFPLSMSSKNGNKIIINEIEGLKIGLKKYFEDADIDSVDLKEFVNDEKELWMGFVGKNFLPSKLCEKIGDRIIIFEENQSIEREIQNFLISFVKNFEVGEIGCLKMIYHSSYGWKLSKIDLYPDLSEKENFAKMWKISGLDYKFLINKIISN